MFIIFFFFLVFTNLPPKSIKSLERANEKTCADRKKNQFIVARWYAIIVDFHSVREPTFHDSERKSTASKLSIVDRAGFRDSPVNETVTL